MSGVPAAGEELPLAIVQARMSSSRLPGKVMLDLAGKPMILRQLERITRAQRLSGIVVATSTDPSDDPLAELLTRHGYNLVRGSLDDVLGRFVQVLDEYRPTTVARITADCPLISPTVIDQVVEAFSSADVDYCSNTLVPTYPDGLDVEIVRADVLRDVHRNTTDTAEQEHVTLGIYRHPETYRILNFRDPSGDDHSDLRWTVDNAEDFTFVEWVVGNVHRENHDFDYADVLTLLDQHPARSRTARDSARNEALHGLDTGAMSLGDEV